MLNVVRFDLISIIIFRVTTYLTNHCHPNFFLNAKILFFIAARSQPLHCEITHVDRVSSFSWKVPCFPVLTLEFVKVLFKHGSVIKQGVVQKCVAPELKKGKYLCSAHCQIDVAESKYTVLWKLTLVLAIIFTIIFRASFLDFRISFMTETGLAFPLVRRELNSPSVVNPKREKKSNGRQF